MIISTWHAAIPAICDLIVCDMSGMAGDAVDLIGDFGQCVAPRIVDLLAGRYLTHSPRQSGISVTDLKKGAFLSRKLPGGMRV
jgi:hypothetical protein